MFGSSLFITIVSLPFAPVKGYMYNETKLLSENGPAVIRDSLTAGFQANAISLYNSLHLDLMGLSRQTFEYAIKGFIYLAHLCCPWR